MSTSACAVIVLALLLACLPHQVDAQDPLREHDPISIVGDGSLVEHPAVSGGDGLSWDTALVIDGLHIDQTSYSPALTIESTTLHLVVQRCVIEAPGQDLVHQAIQLINASNVRIMDCELPSSGDGILVKDCEDILVQQDEVRDPKRYGIIVVGSSNVTVTDCLIESAQGAIDVVSSHNTTLARNEIRTYVEGIKITNSSGTVVAGNSFDEGEQTGIILVDSDGNLIAENGLHSHMGSGIVVVRSDGNVLSRNSLEWNGRGIVLDGSRVNTVEDNAFFQNRVGLRLDTATDNTIRGNVIDKSRGTNLELLDSTGNAFIGNRISKGFKGIVARDSQENEFRDNLVIANWWAGTDGDLGQDLQEGNTVRVNGWFWWIVYALGVLVCIGVGFGTTLWWRNRKKEKEERGKVLIRRRFPKGDRGLWAISKYLLDEDLFRSQLEAAGPQREMILERYERNIQSARQMQYFATGAMAFFLAFMSSLPLGAALNLSIVELSGTNVNDVLFATAMAMGFYYLMSFMILLVFGLLFLAQLMKGDIFRLLSTLPLDRRLNRRVIQFLLVRLYGLPFAVILLFYPIGGLIITGSIAYMLVTIAINFVYMAFVAFIMVILTNILSQRVYSAKATKSATMMRVMVMAGYLVSMMFVMVTIQFLIQWVGDLYVAERLAGGSGQVINSVIALIPFPFAGGYVTAMTIVPLDLVPIPILLATLGGTALMGVTLYRVRRMGNAVLERVATGTELFSRGADQASTIEDVTIAVSPPRTAMAKHMLVVTSRDMGSIMYLIMPIIFPLIMIVTTLSERNQSISEPLLSFMMYMGVIPFLVNMSLSTSDANMGGVLSSLPFSVKDQYRARQAILIAIALTPLAMIGMVSYNRVVEPDRFLMLVGCMAVLMVALSTLYLITFSLAFGLVNRRYTFFLARVDNKLLKYIGVILLQYLVGIGLLATFHVLFQAGVLSWNEGMALVVGGSLVLLAILELGASRLFPDPTKARTR